MPEKSGYSSYFGYRVHGHTAKKQGAKPCFFIKVTADGGIINRQRFDMLRNRII